MSKFKHKSTMRCKSCGAEFYSRYSGEFRTCNCWHTGPDQSNGCAIDETEWYCRWIGSNFELKATVDGTHIKKGDWYDPIKDLAESQIN